MNSSQKNKLRLPLEKLPSPIKKNYDYYKHLGNSWNSKYLSSPKIAKYYIEPHESYLAGPTGPDRLSVIESTERTRRHDEKAAKNKIESRQRLVDRKSEREKMSKQAIKPRKATSTDRPNTRNFQNFFKNFSIIKHDYLEPLLLTQHNFSETDGKKRFDGRQNIKHFSLKFNRRNSLFKNYELHSQERPIQGRKVMLKKLEIVDQSKVREILKEIEDFEEEYARRVRLRSS